MAEDDRDHSRSGVPHELAWLGARATAPILRPLNAIFELGLSLERRAVARVLDSSELEQLLSTVLDSARVDAAFARAIESEGARRLVDSFFDSSLFDRVIERLVASDALWLLVDEIADSPAVAAAISQQGLGFADQVGDEVRARSRKADDWLERAARRLTRRHPRSIPAEPAAGT